VKALGVRLGVAVGDDAAPEFRDAVNATVDGLDAIEDGPPAERSTDPGERSW
jgi:hypothetical protein